MRLSLDTFLAISAAAKPTLWIIVDSTDRTPSDSQMGGGDPLVADPRTLENRHGGENR